MMEKKIKKRKSMETKKKKIGEKRKKKLGRERKEKMINERINTKQEAISTQININVKGN